MTRYSGTAVRHAACGGFYPQKMHGRWEMGDSNPKPERGKGGDLRKSQQKEKKKRSLFVLEVIWKRTNAVSVFHVHDDRLASPRRATNNTVLTIYLWVPFELLNVGASGSSFSRWEMYKKRLETHRERYVLPTSAVRQVPLPAKRRDRFETVYGGCSQPRAG